MTPYNKQNLVYKWVDFSKFFQIWAKMGSNLRKFWKNWAILLKIWPKVGPFGIWMGHFFFKIGISMGQLSNFAVARPYHNQTWVPPLGTWSICTFAVYMLASKYTLRCSRYMHFNIVNTVWSIKLNPYLNARHFFIALSHAHFHFLRPWASNQYQNPVQNQFSPELKKFQLPEGFMLTTYDSTGFQNTLCMSILSQAMEWSLNGICCSSSLAFNLSVCVWIHFRPPRKEVE